MSRGMLRIAAAVVAAGMLSACSGDLIAVLPHEDGSVGGVVVTKGGNQVVLDKPLTATKTGSGLSSYAIPKEEVEQRFGAALTAQPIPPRNFVLYFREGGVRLVDTSKPTLDDMLKDAAKRPTADFLVVGHTDKVGLMADNDKLSRDRAAKVIDFLVGVGVPRDRVTSSGRGEREPLVPTRDEVEEPRNRRVEIDVR